MTTLSDLSKERADTFVQYTDKMLASVQHITDAVGEILDEESSEFLQWKSVDVVGDLVLIIGTVAYPEGHNLQLPTGETIIINDENRDLTARAIRVGIPIDYALNSNKEKVKEYLLKNTELPTNHMSEETKAQKIDVQDMNEPPKTNEFDISSLSEDQIQRMVWFERQTSPDKVS